MNPTKLYAMLRVTDIAAAEAWYGKLLGRGPDNRPMPSLVQWDLSDTAGIGLATDELISGGKASINLFIDDIPAERRRLADLGIALGEDIDGDYSQMAVATDPDGNRVTLSTPPSPPYPPA